MDRLTGTGKHKKPVCLHPGAECTSLPWHNAVIAKYHYEAERSNQEQSSACILRSVVAVPKSSL